MAGLGCLTRCPSGRDSRIRGGYLLDVSSKGLDSAAPARWLSVFRFAQNDPAAFRFIDNDVYTNKVERQEARIGHIVPVQR